MIRSNQVLTYIVTGLRWLLHEDSLSTNPLHAHLSHPQQISLPLNHLPLSYRSVKCLSGSFRGASWPVGFQMKGILIILNLKLPTLSRWTHNRQTPKLQSQTQFRPRMTYFVQYGRKKKVYSGAGIKEIIINIQLSSMNTWIGFEQSTAGAIRWAIGWKSQNRQPHLRIMVSLAKMLGVFSWPSGLKVGVVPVAGEYLSK